MNPTGPDVFTSHPTLEPTPMTIPARAWRPRALFALLTPMLLLGLSAPSRAGLDDYVKKADPAFTWKLEATESVPSQGSVIHIRLISQEWQGIRWQHHLQIYEPAKIDLDDTVLLFITGGNIEPDSLRKSDKDMGFTLAKLCGARVAVLPQVPNQPLLGDKKEDTLIAETFVRYLETKDENWPLLFPMVKSAVKAMDAVQHWARQEGKPAVKRFVVTGASKRGWTTWLTGATDPRVIAIAPMVIDTLNMKAQMAHAMEVWGKPSEQIEDYVHRGLIQRINEPDGQKLWKMVDPFSYLDRLTLPKLLINGLNDRYWTVDALNIYWNELKGPKSVVYLPNAGHNLAVNRDYALNGLAAFFRTNVTGRPWPQLTWKHGDDGNGTLTLNVQSTPEPVSASLWVAKSDTRDFRDSTWEPTLMSVSGSTAKGSTPRPEKGYIAVVGEIEYKLDGITYHLSTQVRQTGAKETQ
jgi:PhoPQ-activated pathogenicity-related protein